jgi:hypothetical protein
MKGFDFCGNGIPLMNKSDIFVSERRGCAGIQEKGN